MSGKSIIQVEVLYDKNSETGKNKEAKSDIIICGEGGSPSGEIGRELPIPEEIVGFPEAHIENIGGSRKESSSLCTSLSKRQILQLRLESARKKAALEEKMEEEKLKIQERRYLREKELIDMELNVQLSTAGSKISSISENIKEGTRDGIQKVKNWFRIPETNQIEHERDSSEQKSTKSDENKLKFDHTEYMIPDNSDKDREKFAEKGVNRQLETFFTRQSIRELPLFNGDPEEWPLFISQFRRSTKSCQFSEEENLIRLQKCLRGRAREIVKPLLISSRNLDVIMESLEMNFGRPDIIISMLIEKAKKVASPGKGRTDSLIHFSNAVLNLTSTIEVLDTESHMNNMQLLDELSRKLPYFLRLDWGERLIKNPKDINLKTFSERLKEKAKISCYIDSPLVRAENSGRGPSAYTRRDTVLSISRPKTEIVKKYCPKCTQNHQLYDCEKFKEMTEDDRWKIVTDKKLCMCCLRSNHFKHQCFKETCCGIDNCSGLHHPLLHKSKNSPHGYENPEEIRTEHVNLTKNDNYNVLLKILPVEIKYQEKKMFIYVFYDDGSTVSLIDADLAEKLELVGETESLCYQWTNGITHQEDNSKKVDFDISDPRHPSKYFRLNGVRTIKNMKLPRQTLDIRELKRRYSNTPFLDHIEPYYNERPLLLIGQDQCHLLNPRRIVELQYNGPIISETPLGWTVHGRVQVDTPNREEFLYHICNEEKYAELHSLVKTSFSTESFGVRILEKLTKTKEETRCERIMEDTTKRIGFRFETGLLWRTDDIKFPDNQNNALSRLYCMERKMDKDARFAEEYCMKIADYVTKGYARKLREEEITTDNLRLWYLPHFGVFNENKKKLRIVFDAASKTKSVSLNTELLQGPDLLRPLTGVLITFRQNKIAFTGDIKEMFHQVVIRKEDRTAQRFFWRGRERQKDPEVYEMMVMTFGATCSPCLAQFIKNKNAVEHEKEYRDASKAILKKHYVDDYLDSKCTEDEAIKQIKRVVEVKTQYGTYRRPVVKLCKLDVNGQRNL